MQKGLVSILIPFKDTEDFLEECLDSILAQTYLDWEVIAVDDHSEDESYGIVSQYAQKDTRIHLMRNLGKGIIPALQLGYKNAKGNFITRMDSDDIMMPHRLEKMRASLQKKGRGHLSVGLVNYFSDRGISNGYFKYENWLNRLTRTGSNFSEIYKECVIPSPCWMAFREDFEACGGFLSERYPEDYDLSFRFYEHKMKIIPCNEVLLKWRDYDHRTSRTHQHYAQNYFLDIKTHYYLKLDRDTDRPLVIWGAGFKGKTIAKKLIAANIDFTWLCDNPRKIDKKIYDQRLLHFSQLATLENPQSIITVANEEDQTEIENYLLKLRQVPMKDYFFFC